MATKKKPVHRRKPEITFQVRWNMTHRTFDIYREGASTGGFARDRATAIGLARRDAEEERPGVTVAVMAVQDGKPTVEWSNRW
jgi:hypothetical protein